MSGFVASEAVEALDYDFTKFVPGCQGTTPEPTDAQVRRMQYRINKLTNPAEGESANERLAKLSEDEWVDLRDDIVAYVADVTSNEPSAEQIQALPYRVQVAYIGWLMGQLVDPKSAASGTSRSLRLAK